MGLPGRNVSILNQVLVSESKLHRKVYMVSEEAHDLSVLNQIIENRGFSLIRDTRRDELVTHIRANHPDLILWDAQILDHRSLLYLQNLRENIETKFTPIYVFATQNGINHSIRSDIDSIDRVSVLDGTGNFNELETILDGILRPSVGLKFWGVRGSTPCANKENIIYGGNTTCVQIELPHSDDLLILDSGTGIRNLGNYLTEFKEEVKGHIFITHPHWDHIQGFPFFKPIYNPDNHFDIHMPPQVNGGCMEILSGHLTKTFFPVTLEMIDANIEYVTQTGERQQYDGYEVEYMLANHPINTAIYKIHIAGKQIVFCPDNELTPIEQKTEAYFYKKLKEFFYGVDLLIHDAQFNKSSYKKKVGWGHSAWETTVDFAIRSKVKNLFLTHHDPDSNDSHLKYLDQHVQNVYGDQFESIQLAKEGVKIQMEVGETISES